MTTHNAGLGSLGPTTPESRKAAADKLRNENLAKARAVAAANRRGAKTQPIDTSQELAVGMDADNLGTAAARQVPGQARPGTVVGRNERGRVIVIGRDGQPISRLGDRSVDKYAVPKEEIPQGWAYQWIAETVLNEPQTSAILQFRQAQWTEVPQSRHPTVPVRQGGLVLVERPAALTKEARDEEMQEAKEQVKANVEQFMPGKGMPKTGFIRKGRPVAVDEDGVAPPTVELA